MTLPVPDLAMLLLDAGLRGAVLLLLALGATRLMRRASAAARHLVWSAALAGVVLLPLAGALLPRWRVLPLPAAVAPAVESAALPPSAPARAASAPETGAPAAAGAAPVVVAAEGGAPPAPRGADWRLLLLLAWLTGSGLLALRLGYGTARVWWLERRAVEITDDAWVRVVDGLARRLRVGRIVTLLRGPGATVPMTWGLIHPVVLLPEEADAWDDERRGAVLAHELAHVRRWDALTQWIAHLAMALFWFNPLVWVACRKVREEREHACDDAVLAMGTLPTRYADHLLDIVRSLGTGEGPAAALAMARRSQFEGRLLAILDRATPRGGVTRRAVLATLALTAALVVPLAALAGAPRAAAPAVEAAPAEAPGEPRRAPAAKPAGAARPDGAAESAGAAERAGAEESAGPAEPAAAALRAGGPSAPESPAVAAAGTLGDEDARARYLVALVEQQPADTVYAEIARAAARMASPSAQRQVLSAVVACPAVGRAGMLAAVEATASVRSTSEQRVVLAQVVERGWLRDAGVRRAFFRTLDTLSGSSDRRHLLRMVLERGHTDPESLASVIAAAGRLQGSTDVRNVLMPAASTGRVTGALREQYLRVASAIPDESERALVLAALVDGGDRAGAPDAPARQAGGGTQDSDGWTTRADLSDGVLEYDDVRDGVRWGLSVVGSEFSLRANGATAAVAVRPGGRVVLSEKGPTTRSVEIRADAAGRETRSWTVDGTRRAYDAEAAAWMEGFLRRLARHLEGNRRPATR